MADIKSYLKEKEKREQSRSTYKDKIMRHKLASVYRVLLLAGALAALVVLVIVQYKRHVYTGYDVLSTVPLEASRGATDVRLQSSVLTYSKDGAHCTNAKGEVKWNQTYEIQDIMLTTCQNVAAIGGYNDREIYVQDTEKQLGTITTNMPIRGMAVSATGNVTAVLADTNVTWINTYDSTGKMLFTGQAHMQETGYPVAVSLSPNGVLLAVSYIYLDAGVMKTNVVFYNFDAVGENNGDRIVGIYFYPDVIVPEIHFVDNETAFAVGDDRLMIFKGGQTPVDNGGYMYNKEIQSVFYGDKYVGLVLVSDDAAHQYMLDVYNTDGKQTGRYYFDIEYNDILFEKEGFVVYNETECLIMTYGGVEKFNNYFTKAVNLMIPTETAYRYMLVTDTSIDVIQLK